jgi:ABC-type branched-subunit amino acid transport system substrate-binding protein
VRGNLPSEVVAPLAQREKVPLVAISTDPAVNEKRPWVISYQAVLTEFGGRLARYLDHRALTSVAVVKTTLSYYVSMARAMERQLPDSVKISVNEEVAPSEMDFRSIATRIRKSNVKALGVFLMAGQISEFCKQISQQGISAQIFGTEDLATRTDIERVPSP